MSTEIIELINKDPHKGMTLLMERYTALIWKIVSFHLSNPEDIKECVNETFTKFYFCKDKYNPAKSDLPTFLSAIARNLSITRYRKESLRYDTPLSDLHSSNDIMLISAETRTDLKRAISTLKKNEQQIILMKYYGGMTIQEIATSLSLPYETVKKRHQRSLHKLKYFLLCILLTLLLALLTACTYKILLYYKLISPGFQKISIDLSLDLPQKISEQCNNTLQNVYHQIEEMSNSTELPENTINDYSSPKPDDYSFVPGYGINETPEVPAYKLLQSVSLDTDEMALTLNDASYVNGILRMDITYYQKDSNHPANSPSYNLVYDRTSTNNLVITNYTLNENVQKNELSYYNAELSSHIETNGHFTLEINENNHLSFSLVSAESETIDNKYYQLADEGGIMAIPRFESDSLIITIYPLNHGEYTTLPGLIRGIYGETENGEISITDVNGEKFIGKCVRYRPYNFAPYYDWDFGNVPPGQYTLHIPYLYQSARLPEGFKLPINLDNLSWSDTEYPLPGGTLSINNCINLSPAPGDYIGDSTLVYEAQDTNNYWKLCLECNSDTDKRTIIGINLIARCPNLPEYDPYEMKDIHIRLGYTSTKNDIANHRIESVISANPYANDLSQFYLEPENRQYGEYKDTILYRWNQSFTLPFIAEKIIE